MNETTHDLSHKIVCNTQAGVNGRGISTGVLYNKLQVVKEFWVGLLRGHKYVISSAILSPPRERGRKIGVLGRASK